MTELLGTVASWPSLLLVLLVFGFAPGFCLRLIVLAYPRDDPRRKELIGELYAVPRIKRPLWVAEQLEVALFDGLVHRVSATLRRLTGRRRTRRQTAGRGVRLSRIEWVALPLTLVSGGAALWNLIGGVLAGGASARASFIGIGFVLLCALVIWARSLVRARLAARRLDSGE